MAEVSKELTKLDRRKELAFFDEASARALINLLPERMASQLRLVWNGELGYLFSLAEPQLISEMRRAQHPPAPVDQILRARFWYEFNRCQDDDWRRPKMDMALVIGRDMAREVFFTKYILNPYKLTYMLLPPVNFKTALEAALDASLSKVMAAVDKLEVIDRTTGDVKSVNYDKMLKTFELLHAKVNTVGGAAGLKRSSRSRKAIEEPPPLVRSLSVDEQLSELKLKNAELERLRVSDLKKETGAL